MKMTLRIPDMPETLYEAYKDRLERYYGATVTKEDGVVRVKHKANTVQCMEIVSITNLYRLSEEAPEWD